MLGVSDLLEVTSPEIAGATYPVFRQVWTVPCHGPLKFGRYMPLRWRLGVNLVGSFSAPKSNNGGAFRGYSDI
ncbi:hypothetical protein RSAG8_05116, partial [Rhizoctonia solani AG-8 WAC10335]